MFGPHSTFGLVLPNLIHPEAQLRLSMNDIQVPARSTDEDKRERCEPLPCPKRDLDGVFSP